MKLSLLFTFLICLSLVSCKKDKDNENTIVDNKTLQYKVNGTLVEIKGERSWKYLGVDRHTTSNTNGQTTSVILGYTLWGIIQDKGHGIELKITDNTAQGNWLAEKTYEYNYPNTEGSRIALDYVFHKGAETGDFVKLTITKIHDGTADGTFSARLSDPLNPTSKLLITEGTFKNLEIL